MNSWRHRKWRRAGKGVLAAAVVALVMAPTPSHASRNIGAGVVHGTVQFDSPGLAQAGQPCVPGTFDLVATGAAGAMNTVITGYVGTLSITGEGTTNCGSATASGGTLRVFVTGTGPTSSQIDCGPLEGFFTRAVLEIVVLVTGSCTINKYGTAPIQFLANLVFSPATDPPGQGVNQSIMTANFDGPFVLAPLG